MSDKPQEIPKEALPKLWQQMRWCPADGGHYTPYQVCPLHSIETLNVRVYASPK